MFVTLQVRLREVTAMDMAAVGFGLLTPESSIDLIGSLGNPTAPLAVRIRRIPVGLVA